MIKRLRIKFICINMTIVTAMLYVIFSLILFFMGLGMEIQSQNMMQTILDNASRPNWHQEKRQEVWRPHFVVRIGSQGEILAIDSGYFEEMEEETLRTLTAEALAQKAETGSLKNRNLRFRKKPALGGQTIVFLDMSAEISTMKNLTGTCIVISGISFLIFLVISFLLARWAIRPVENAWNQQRQFVADASHELKTPLTVIMTNAELLQSPEYPEQERARFAESILTMSYQMRGLVESLLELARVDNGTAKMTFSELDFSELVSEGLLPFEPLYFERDLLLESRIQGEIRVKGSSAHLRQVLDILLDNAAKYSSPGAQVTVTLSRQGNHCLLTVANPGAPIGKEDLKNIFKRFYRIDKARAMNHSYGLGLSIADSIVKEHGGRIWAESEGGINTFFLQLTALP